MPRDGKLTTTRDADAYPPTGSYRLIPGVAGLNTMAPESEPNDFPLDFDTASKMFRSGLVTIDQNRIVLLTNRKAAEILDGSEAVALRKGALFIERASVQRTFEAMVRSTVEAHEAGSAPVSSEFVGIPDRTGDVRYAIKIVTVKQRHDRIEILLALIDFVDQHAPTRSTVAAVFRLSDREAELAVLFSLGCGLEEISTRMGVALNTTRVHLRSVFQKTNCSGQLALLRTLTRLTGAFLLNHLARNQLASDALMWLS